MRKPRKKSIEIRNFILENIVDHPRDITLLASQQFDISRPAVLRHIHKLIAEGIIIAHGITRDRHYELKLLVDESFTFDLSNNVEEDKVWRHLVRPLLREMPGNVMSICEYGINEMSAPESRSTKIFTPRFGPIILTGIIGLNICPSLSECLFFKGNSIIQLNPYFYVVLYEYKVLCHISQR